ncbi:hypothetical protein [Nocardia alba]|uniref:Uncharacterized protein n=1 Tax=Nocardia alba TaxID=225051 RepID=A0A4V2PC33_9NOCA|nr:hypothetical protein [Nocardia alba]TCJ99715.1 hypothetical protein DFR71_0697 [Nocardia alba]
MDNSRAKLVGPAVAVGAVSLGLIIIGACGVGQQDVYVPAPPLSADLAAAPARSTDNSTSTTVHIPIPPSPSWRIAPYMSPRKPFSLSSTETSPSETPPREGEPAPEPGPAELTTESRPAETAPRPPTTTEDEPTTTRPQLPTRQNPTRTVTPPRVGDDEASDDYPPTHVFDHAPTTVVPADTGATPTTATTTEATTTETPAPATAAG